MTKKIDCVKEKLCGDLSYKRAQELIGSFIEQTGFSLSDQQISKLSTIATSSFRDFNFDTDPNRTLTAFLTNPLAKAHQGIVYITTDRPQTLQAEAVYEARDILSITAHNIPIILGLRDDERAKELLAFVDALQEDVIDPMSQMIKGVAVGPIRMREVHRGNAYLNERLDPIAWESLAIEREYPTP